MHLQTEEHIKIERTQRIKAKAEALGFISCGIAKAEFLEEEAPRLEQWLTNNYQGEMSYMANHFDMRLDPRLLVEGAKSVISLAYNYYQELDRNPDSYKVAMYAQGEDYHFVVKEKVRELLDFIQEEIGEVEGRAFTDSAPILEHAWAKKAGIGWVGKNSLTLSKQKGSFFFLAELILDLDLAYDNAIETDHCGKCTRCIDACPTEAILPNRVDCADGGRLCIELGCCMEFCRFDERAHEHTESDSSIVPLWYRCPGNKVLSMGKPFG